MAWSYPLYSFRWPPREPGVAAWSLPLLLWGFTAARQQKEGVEIESGMCLLRCPKCAVRGNEMRIYFPIGNTSIDHPSRPKTGLPKPPPQICGVHHDRQIPSVNTGTTGELHLPGESPETSVCLQHAVV